MASKYPQRPYGARHSSSPAQKCAQRLKGARVCHLLIPAHVPDPSRRVRLRRLDSGPDRRALQYRHIPAVCSSIRGSGFIGHVSAGWAQNWAQEKTSPSDSEGEPDGNWCLVSGLGGERGWNRTTNLLIKSQLLCQLSYAPSMCTDHANRT